MDDRNSDPLRVSMPRGHPWQGQLPHLLLLAALLPGVWAIASPALDGGEWLGVDERVWLLAGVLVPVAHQTAVALAWRGQLSWAIFTRVFGDAGLSVWGGIFFPLLIARPLAMIGLAVADAGSLAIPPLPSLVLGVLLLLPAAWTVHSIETHFGFARAIGGDHFFERYRTLPMVRKGAFAWSSNAMYTFAFLGLWGIALIARSRAALAVALFQHAYIWVHWYCTEQPDGVVLYGRSPDDAESEL
ncbi:MAG TPA: methyltransferase [Acidobacteriota bacterium]|nr:methyltransferase [Acidobacteriota bacterium]